MPSTVDEKFEKIHIKKTTRYYTRSPPSVFQLETITPQGSALRELTSRSWSNTPAYRTKRESGTILPVNSYTGEFIQSMVDVPVVRKTSVYSNGDRVDVTYEQKSVGSIPSLTTYPVRPTSEALIRAYGAAKGSSWNVPVFVGELGKTSGMVLLAANRIVRASRALKRGRFDLFVRYLNENNQTAVMSDYSRGLRRFNQNFGRHPSKTYSSFWLEYSYGWRPLMMDVRNAVETLCDMAERPDTLVAKAKGRSSLTKETSTTTRLFSFEGVYVDGTLSDTFQYSSRVTCGYIPKPGSIPDRLGLVNPLEVAWELTPLSFVADWFAPIGSYLEGFGAGLSMTPLYTSVGERQEVIRTCLGTRSPDKSVTFSGPNSRSKRVMVTRRSRSGPPVIGARDLFLKVPTTVSQAVSAVALLRQQFRN